MEDLEILDVLLGQCEEVEDVTDYIVISFFEPNGDFCNYMRNVAGIPDDQWLSAPEGHEDDDENNHEECCHLHLNFFENYLKIIDHEGKEVRMENLWNVLQSVKDTKNARA